MCLELTSSAIATPLPSPPPPPQPPSPSPPTPSPATRSLQHHHHQHFTGNAMHVIGSERRSKHARTAELNELRKPSSDNPEILRFFRYMKAAKDGQDGLDCFALHPGCVVGAGAAAATATAAGKAEPSELGAPPMLKTYQDINKLVQARRLARTLRLE
ncbi:Uncharacterized protein GBIM_15575, partial [Gryllus bimaculatus]